MLLILYFELLFPSAQRDRVDHCHVPLCSYDQTNLLLSPTIGKGVTHFIRTIILKTTLCVITEIYTIPIPHPFHFRIDLFLSS